MKEIQESRSIPVCGEYDVIVVGGGAAGICAAIAAARHGAKTLLLEKSAALGGLATAGHVVVYLPLCDGEGRRVIGGLPAELLLSSIRYGYGNLPAEWMDLPLSIDSKKRCRTVFNGPAFAMALDEELLSSGADLLLDTVFCDAIMEDGQCRGVLVENKSGRQAYLCRAAVDASGDADLMFRAGAECVEQGNRLAYWAYCLARQDGSILASGCSPNGALKLFALGNIGDLDAKAEYLGTDARQVTRFLLDGRRQALKALKEAPDLTFASFPSMAQFRTTRRIRGLYTLTQQDQGRNFPDSVGCTGDWRSPGPVYEIPLRALCAKGIRNLFAAGRIISSCGDAWEITRVIPPAGVTGQAAGTAAYLASCEKKADAERIQALLFQDGAILHPK